LPCIETIQNVPVHAVSLPNRCLNLQPASPPLRIASASAIVELAVRWAAVVDQQIRPRCAIARMETVSASTMRFHCYGMHRLVWITTSVRRSSATDRWKRQTSTTASL